MKVKFKNGYETEMGDEVAKVYIAKGKVTKIIDDKPEQPKRSPVKPKKSEQDKPVSVVSGVQRKDEADDE